MKKVLVSMVAVAGCAAAANAEVRGTSTLTYQVRAFNAAQGPNDGWSSSFNMGGQSAPNFRIEVRALVSWSGDGPAPFALSGAIFQPTLSGWNGALDSLQDDNTPIDGGDFVAFGGGPSGGTTQDSGNYGRVIPFSSAGIGTSAALRAHTNNVLGVNYMRIAQNTATNWVGVGSSTNAANNVTGALGVTCVQKPIPQVTATDPESALGSENIVVFKFAVNLTGTDVRTLVVDTPAAGIRDQSGTAGAPAGTRGFTWYSAALNSADIVAPVVVQPATIITPTPASLALLGLGGLVAARRRR